MQIHKLPRYLRGYVTFEINSLYSNEFLNFCANNNIDLFSTKIIDKKLISNCLVSDYKKTSKVRISGLKKKIVKRHGVRFFTNRYKKRIGLSVGFILMTLFLIILSGNIWQIDISGNERLSDNVILNTLEECGFSLGVSKSKLNISEIENEMMMKLVDLSRISINLDGSYANIIVKERQMVPPYEDKSKPSNLIASNDGIITKMEIVKGKPVALEGSGVKKGQLLVAGLYNDKKDNIILEHSSGKVTAQVEISKTFSISYSSEKEIGKEEKNFYTLKAFEINMPLYIYKKPNEKVWIKQEKNTQLNILGLKFPFYIIEENYTKPRKANIKISKNEAKEKVIEEILHFEAQEFESGEIVKKHVTWKSDNEKCVAQVDYEVLLDIAQQQYIEN